MNNNTITEHFPIDFPYAERLLFVHPKYTFPITNASNIALRAISKNYKLLKGIGIDWGCGCGCLSILAAKIELVNKIFGLDINKSNIDISQKNSESNETSEKCVFYESDSFIPNRSQEKEILDTYKGRIDFIVANPPSSKNDDGFSFRRLILQEANEYLSESGILLLNISSQYGISRINELSNGLFFVGNELESSDWEEFDLNRTDLFNCLKSYVKEENNGGRKYEFYNPSTNEIITAVDVLSNFKKNGIIPYTKWQVHIFKKKKYH